VGTAPVAIAIGDFNGDGKSDLAVANSGSNNVSILLNNGDGSFQPAVNYSVGISPQEIVAGDFDGNGKVDLIVANQGDLFNHLDGSLRFLKGNGDGTFQAAVSVNGGANPRSILAGDLNGDKKLDLIVYISQINLQLPYSLPPPLRILTATIKRTLCFRCSANSTSKNADSCATFTKLPFTRATETERFKRQYL